MDHLYVWLVDRERTTPGFSCQNSSTVLSRRFKGYFRRGCCQPLPDRTVSNDIRLNL